MGYKTAETVFWRGDAGDDRDLGSRLRVAIKRV